jgi:hypothetical protein
LPSSVPKPYFSRRGSAATAGGKHVSGRRHKAWIAADPFRGDLRVIITGPQGFERYVAFAVNEDPAEISRRVRETIEAET